jgi:hypothetical protein
VGLCWRATPQGIARPGRENDPPGPGPPIGPGLFVLLTIIFLSCHALKTHLSRHQTTLDYARYCLAEPELRSLKSRPVSDLVDYPSFRRCLTSPEGIALRRLKSSFNRAALLIRLIELGVQTVNRAIRGTKPNRNQTLLLAQCTKHRYGTKATAAGFGSPASLFHGSLRNNIIQQRTSSLRATATIAFFLRVFCLLQRRSYTDRAHGL